MDLREELKQVQQIISGFMEKMDYIEKGCRSHLELLKTAKKKERRQIEVSFKHFVDSLRSKRDQREAKSALKVRKAPEGLSRLVPVEESSDDEFDFRGARQKPKKPLCLSITKSAQNRSKPPAMGKLLSDRKPGEEQGASSTPKPRRANRESAGNPEDETRISISWTIKIKESSAQHSNQVRITGSERVNFGTPYACKPITVNDSQESLGLLQSEAAEIQEKPKSSNEQKPYDSGNEEISIAFKDFQECRVVVRKLSTSHKICQPKVVLRRLTDDEIRKICGTSHAPAARYTSLILEPARETPRMFSTVKMRSSVMKLVLTAPQGDSGSEATKPAEPVSSNEMVRSMFRSKSKCVQEWRSRTRTKDIGGCELNPRKSLESVQDNHPGAALTATKRSKCIQRLRSNYRTKTRQERKTKISGEINVKPIGANIPGNLQNRVKMLEQKTFGSKHVQRYTEEQKQLKVSDVVSAKNPERTTNNCQTTCGNPPNQLKQSSNDHERRKLEIKLKTPTKVTEHPTWKDRKGTHKNLTSKSPKKMALITPTRLKYSFKPRSKTVQPSSIQGRAKFEQTRTDSAPHSKNGNIFPGSQLTFLIESFRR